MSKKQAKTKKTENRKPSVKVTLEDVQQSLQDLIQNELAELDKWDDQFTSSEPTTQLNTSPNAIINRKSVHENSQTVSTPIDQGGETQARKKSTKVPRKPGAETIPTKSLDPDDFELEAQPAEIQKSGKTKRKSGTHRDDVSQFEDNIPVLREVATPPPSDSDEPLPESTHARDLAIRVIAKLNIELKRKGEPSLDPTTVNRLQALLRKELEQQAANMDNTPDD